MTSNPHNRSSPPLPGRCYRSLLVTLILAPAICLGAATYHVEYDSLTTVDNSTILALFQTLADDVNASLGLSFVERFDEALAWIDDYRAFILQLAGFRTDLISRGLHAAILDDIYSTEPWGLLALSSTKLIDSQRSLKESIDLARNASKEGKDVEFWIEILKAERDLSAFNSSISGLNSTISSLPLFVNTGNLRCRVRNLTDMLAVYARVIGDLEEEGVPLLVLTLAVDKESLFLGEDLHVGGTFLADTIPVPGMEILIINGSAVLERNVTGVDGVYRAKIHIPRGSRAGLLRLRAKAIFEGGEVASKEILVEILRIPTTITLTAHPDIIPPKGWVTLAGLLFDYHGRALHKEEGIIHTASGQQWAFTTHHDGFYSLTIQVPSTEETLSLRARFMGTRIHQSSKSPWITVRIVKGAEQTMITYLSLRANTTVVRPGEAVEFEGNLSAAGMGPLANQTLEINFLGNTTELTTNDQGRYLYTVTIPLTTPPGSYPAQSSYQPPPATNMSRCHSNTVVITVEGETTEDGRIPTTIDLIALANLANAGEPVGFQGWLTTPDDRGVADARILIGFLGTTRTVTTAVDGSFAEEWPINPDTASGTYPAQAHFHAPAASNLSSSSSNRAYVTILGGVKLHTNLDIRSFASEGKPGERIVISGRLYDDWGRGLKDRVISIQSPNLTAGPVINTSADGSYGATVTLPSAPGRLLVVSTFAGDAEHLPCSSSQLSIAVVVPKKTLDTEIALTAPDQAKPGEAISISGFLRDENGRGLGSRQVSIEWDGQALWFATTGSDGSFIVNATIPRLSAGAHFLQASFNSEDPEYLSSRSRRIEVWVAREFWMTLVLVLAVVFVALFGLAFARGVRPRMGLPGGRPHPRPSQLAPSEGTRPSLESLTARPVAPASAPRVPVLAQGRVALLRAYLQLIELISKTLSLDLSSRTHTEILSLLQSNGIGNGTQRAASMVTRIYERAAYSGHEPPKRERKEFAESLDVLLSSLRTTEGT